MDVNLPELLNRILRKAELLKEKYEFARKQRDEARERIEVLEKENLSLSKSLQEARTEIEYLKISHKIAPGADDARLSQQFLTELVKKIDKCIAQIDDI